MSENFKKPVDTVIFHEDQKSSGGTPEEGPEPYKPTKADRRRFRPGSLVKVGAVAATGVAIAGAIAWGVSANQATEKDPTSTSAPADPSEAPAEPTVEPAPSEAPETPVDAGEGLPTVDELPTMSDETLTELAVISPDTIKQVADDGAPQDKYDASEYAQKLIELIELNVNAGSTYEDYEATFAKFSGGDPDATILRETEHYSEALQDGYAIEDFQLGEYFSEMRVHQLETGYGSHNRAMEFGQEPPVVKTELEYVGSVVKDKTDTTYVIDITFRATDNFFSADALDPEDENIVTWRPELADRDETITKQLFVNVVDEKLQLGRIDDIQQ